MYDEALKDYRLAKKALAREMNRKKSKSWEELMDLLRLRQNKIGKKSRPKAIQPRLFIRLPTEECRV